MKDLTIIGAGPIGMYATVYAAIRQMSVNLIESMPMMGGQLTALYADKYIYDLPGYTKIKAKDFIARLDEQIKENDHDLVDVYLNEEIVEIVKKDDHFVLKSNKNKTYQSRTILFTVGNGVFSPRKIGLDNEDEFDNILYSVQDVNLFENKTLTILGGGDSALDWALMFKDSAKQVNIVHRRDEYRAKEDSIEKLNDSSVNQYMSFLVNKLNGTQNHLDSIDLIHKETNEIVTLQQDYVLVTYGNITKISDFGALNLEKYEFGYKTNRVLETNVEGIYACGNAIYYDGKPKLITVGLGEVPVVINNIKGYIDPSAKGKIFYSSAAQ
ncbi:NAD(P)/FAD-dependent oxidoreductase [Erysipelotrichaceae bacterium OttesenSCG-928-M19]|nr:NAD(P)/FAD-dependent oxidoreductase [Erysipelotrichaceae bacterium OttesenSCG-928-M19]